MSAYWLMKSEPGAFSIEDLAGLPEQRTAWNGVRNYQARNIMRDEMRPGDRVLFYHSGKIPGVVGIARVVSEPYPDHTAWDPGDPHYDPRSKPEAPVWFMVDIQLEQILRHPVLLKNMRSVTRLANMVLLQRGLRLSVQPVTADEYACIVAMGRQT